MLDRVGSPEDRFSDDTTQLWLSRLVKKTCHHQKTYLKAFLRSLNLTSLKSNRDKVGALNFCCRYKRLYTVYVDSNNKGADQTACIVKFICSYVVLICINRRRNKVRI